MKTYPILFRGDMVLAILAGSKTMTRRPVKVPLGTQSDWDLSPVADPVPMLYCLSGDHIVLNTRCGRPAKAMQDHILRCPFGAPGDRLWVRETLRAVPWQDTPARDVGYDADGSNAVSPNGKFYPWCWPGKSKRPSIHMPRWACRLLLDVLSVRVERVESITEADARAEGFPDRAAFLASFGKTYPDLSKNGWVWVVEFKRVEAGT
jgi:hypothetical protein